MPTMMDIIYKKREGGALNREELHYFCQGVKHKTIEDYQTTALLMAIFFRGMEDEEAALFTKEMAASGDTLDLTMIPGLKIDKHSSGGVGDKTSLILCPLMAASGLKIAKLSGRGLGYSGGTLDKLESFPGLRVFLSEEEFRKQAEEVGVVIAGQTASIAPVDKTLYALRDVTATVDSIPLIASSIMSKKLADGSDRMVLDVKCGSGAFMKTEEDATRLARLMVEIGERNGKPTVAMITDMNEPLGHAVGNRLEVLEVIECLKGEGPADLMELVYVLGEEMLRLGELDRPRERMEEALKSGRALQAFRDMLIHQGAKEEDVLHPERLPLAKEKAELLSEEEGYLSGIDSELVGRASVALGAGRETTDDVIDLGAGILLHKKCGAPVKKGEALMTLYGRDAASVERARVLLHGAFTFSKEEPAKRESILIRTVRKEA